MKLTFNHAYGRVTDLDFYYSPVTASFEPIEYAGALETGWLINEWGDSPPDAPEWFQSRVTRISLPHWQEARVLEKEAVLFKKNTDISLKVYCGEEILALDNTLETVFNAYVQERGFIAPLSWRKMLKRRNAELILLAFQDPEEQIIAWSLMRRYNPDTLVSLQFAWNYTDRSREMGKFAQLHELLYAYDNKYKVLNLCSGYERSCAWKARIAGFEWWTGASWSRNKEAYRALCELDSSGNTIFDCMNSHSEMERMLKNDNAA
jgi:hypothetical protein